MKSQSILLSLLVAMAASSGVVSAAGVSITVSGPTGCDPLVVTSAPYADELGFTYTFPAGEQIAFSSVDTTLSACPSTDNPLIINKLVTITNLSPYDFADIYYVANGGGTPGTFSNYDGYINGVMAMKVDSVGNNMSLISESKTANGIFESGEVWQFIVQDYVSPVAVDAFYSPSTVGGSDTLPSIIVPEPSSIALSLLGGLMLVRRRR